MKPQVFVGTVVVAVALLLAARVLNVRSTSARTIPPRKPLVAAADAPHHDAPSPVASSNDVIPALDESPAPRPHVPARPRVDPNPPADGHPARSPTAERNSKATPDAVEPIIPFDVARTALDFVGADPDAEAVWVQAINDPSLTPHQRQDLIEDLNENGFPDPKHVTPDDLPLILSRLALIEDVGPDAMDDVNAAAFAEAYKDLSNMVARLAPDLLPQ